MLRCAAHEQDQVSMKSHCSKTQRYCFGKQQVVSWAYPRRMRLGLIEADPESPGDGLSAAGYPRRMRLGLIEAIVQIEESVSSINTYPRRMRLGLIEARAATASLTLHASYPRRMRLGLIEAFAVFVSNIAFS